MFHANSRFAWILGYADKFSAHPCRLCQILAPPRSSWPFVFMQLKAAVHTAFILDKLKTVYGDWGNTMLGTFFPPGRTAPGSWLQNRFLRRESRLDGLSISSKDRRENDIGGYSIMQWRLSRFEKGYAPEGRRVSRGHIWPKNHSFTTSHAVRQRRCDHCRTSSKTISLAAP